jgi:hypothetical protein
MPTITIEVSDEYLSTLETVFGKDLTVGFANAAFQEWISWLDSSRRFMSITELETERIHTIYNQFLTNSIPSTESIGQIFKLPLGRSRYVVRNLQYKYPEFFRQRRIELIIQALKNAKWSGNNCTIEINVGCRELFDQTVRELRANEEITSEPQGKLVSDRVRYELGNGHYETLRKEFERIIKKEESHG